MPSDRPRRAAPHGAARRAARRRGLEQLVPGSKRRERQAEDLAAERARAQQQQRGDQQTMSFDEARKSQQVAKNQEELLKQADELQQTLEALEDAARRGEEPDTAL